MFRGDSSREDYHDYNYRDYNYDHNRRVFNSIFRAVPSLSHTTPTPEATPDLLFTAPGQSFGSPHIIQNASQQHRAVKRNSTWSIATRFLSIPRLELKTMDIPKTRRRSAEVEEALTYLLVGDGESEDWKEEGLVDWYTSEMRLHFADVVQPVLEKIWDGILPRWRAWDLLEETQEILQKAQSLYLKPLDDHILPILHKHKSPINDPTWSGFSFHKTAGFTRARFQQDVGATFAHAVWSEDFSDALSCILYESACAIFNIDSRKGAGFTKRSTRPRKPNLASEAVTELRERILRLLTGLERVGLGGDDAQKAFASAMDKLMDAVISDQYSAVNWRGKKSIVPNLRTFINEGFCPLIEMVLSALNTDSMALLQDRANMETITQTTDSVLESSEAEPKKVSQNERVAWQDMAMARLGRSRVDNIFDFLVDWDESIGAVLEEFLKLPNSKLYLTNSFIHQVQRRLLHQGSPTTDILNFYISTIRAFHEIEPKGVLLERVARVIRRYLKEREDTASVIISSLLTDTNDDKFKPGGELSLNIAHEMNKPPLNVNHDVDEELNWNDLNWQPLPSDASPDYKKSKSEDVMMFLFILLDREEFIGKLQTLLGEHLLRCADPHYEREIRLLELVKLRLGENNLQACEVMLRDVLMSKRINTLINAGEEKAKGTSTGQNTTKQIPQTPDNPTQRATRSRQPAPVQPSTPTVAPPEEAPTLNAQILSSFFWPPLRADTFTVPSQIQDLQKKYENSFENIKSMRKLEWMNALGNGTVTLELEDRTEIFERLTPAQISIIHAFQPQPGEEWADPKSKGKDKKKGNGDEISVTRSVDQLSEMLKMDVAVVQQALSFWVGQSILRSNPSTSSTSPKYSVIETLTPSTVDADAAAAAQEIAQVQAEAAGAVRSQEDVFNEKKGMYMTLLVGMLTNGGKKSIKEALPMLKIMVPGGPIQEEHVGVLLRELEREGKVIEVGGGVWAIKK